jgi:hypothetical protein
MHSVSWPFGRSRSSTCNPFRYRRAQSVLQLSHAEQQVSVGQRNCFVRSLSLPKTLCSHHDDCTRFSLRVQPCEAWARATFGLCGLSHAHCRSAAISTGELAGFRRTFSFNARAGLFKLPQWQALFRRRPGIQRLPALPHVRKFQDAAVRRRQQISVWSGDLSPLLSAAA